HVGEGAGRDDRQRVVEIPRLRRLVERDVGRAAGPGAAARQEGRADRRVARTAALAVVGRIDGVEERLVFGGSTFGQCESYLTQKERRGVVAPRLRIRNRDVETSLDEEHLAIRRQRP